MNNNMVNNPEQPVPKTTEMNDCDYLNDMLITAKNLTNNYSIVLNEVSNDNLYNQLTKLFSDTQTCQRKMFNLLFAKGWYRLEKAEMQKVTTILNEYEQKVKELP